MSMMLQKAIFLGLKHGKLGEGTFLGGENLELKQFLDIVAEAGKVPKIKLKLKQKYLYLFAYITEILQNTFLISTPR